MENVKSFFDPATFTITYVVWDGGKAAVIDSILDFDPASGATSTASADQVISFIKDNVLELLYIFETHIHADHVTASQYLRKTLGGRIGISENIKSVQRVFAKIFNLDAAEVQKEADFDLYLSDRQELPLGGLTIRAIATPGHTPACMTFVVGAAAFVGDTILMPDSGTARCDFPGGDAATLYASIRKIFSLPDQTTLYMCHDYGADGKRDAAWVTTVAEQKAGNIHIGGGTPEADYIKMRQTRDAMLSMPELILPSVQINMRAGHFPKAEDNGLSYLKLPLNAF